MRRQEYDGYAALAAAIASARRDEYKKALRRYKRSKDECDLGEVRRWERKLQGPVTNLTDEELAALRRRIMLELAGESPKRRKKEKKK